MIRVGAEALLSHWRQNPWQLFTLIAGLAMATALWSGVQAINAEARASYDSAATSIIQAPGGRIEREDGGMISQSEYVAMRRAGWLVSPILEGTVSINGTKFQILGLDPLTLPLTGTESTELTLSDFVEFVSPSGMIVAHPEDAEDLEDQEIPVRIDSNQPQGRLMMDIGLAQRLLGQPGKLTAMVPAVEQPPNLPPLDPALELSERREQGDVARLTESFHLNLTAFGLLSFAVGIFIVYGAIGLAFEQRRPVFRTIRILGMSLRLLMGLMTVELLLIALLSGAMGIGLGYFFAAALLPDVAATLRGLYSAEVSGELTFRPGWWLSGLAMAVGGTAVAAAGGFWRLNRSPLLVATQPRAWAIDAERAGRRMAITALILGGLGLVVGAYAEGLAAGFTLLGFLLIASALLLPLLLDSMLRLGSLTARSAVAEWFWADTRQQLPGLSMALMALLLAMAANIGVSTMVSSFRLTFVGWLDQRLASELYLTPTSQDQAQEIIDYLQGRADAVLPIIHIDTRIGGLPAEVYGVVDHATYRQNWKLLASTRNVWDELARGEGALINEQLARRNGLWVGDNLNAPLGSPIIGIYGDYGNPTGQVVLGMDQFRSRYPDAQAQRYGIRSGKLDPKILADELRERFDLGPDALVDQARIKAISLSIFERTFAVTAALNVLTLSVAGFAILISLLTLATMRLPQLAPVWALGLTRRRLAGLELVRAVCLATFTGLVAVPLGLGLAWILLAVVNVQAFGWRLPMYLFPIDYLSLGLLTVLAAILAALWPAIRLARTPADALLKVFSNER